MPIHLSGVRQAQAERCLAGPIQLLSGCPSGRQILESHTVPAPETLARLCYSPQELGMVLQSIVEPVVLAFETDQYARRFPMPCDEDFLRLGEASGNATDHL